PNTEVALAAGQALARRLPNPALSGAPEALTPLEAEAFASLHYLTVHSWRAEFTPDARAAARKLLSSEDSETVRIGATIIGSIGVPEDGPLLSEAITRAIGKVM